MANEDFEDEGAPAQTGEIMPPISRDMSPLVAAEINQQIATARRFPRRRDADITSEIMGRATLDEETAGECMYTLPRAGKDISGPSIRFAEIVAASYGNLRIGARFVDIDMKDPKRAAVIIEGVCLDLQSNLATMIPIRRSIVGKKGIFNADMTNIAFSAGSAIARREAVLKTVPKAIWGSGFRRVVAVLMGDANTLMKRRQDVMAAFVRLKVDPKLVFAELDVVGEEDIKVEHMPRLIGMLTALRDGSESIGSMFGGAARERGESEASSSPMKDPPTERIDGKTGEVTRIEPTASELAQGRGALGDDPDKPQTPSGEKAQAAREVQAEEDEEVLEARKRKETQEAKERAAAANTAQKVETPPRNVADYIKYAEAWIAATPADQIATIRPRWSKERPDRNAFKDRPLDETELKFLQDKIKAREGKA